MSCRPEFIKSAQRLGLALDEVGEILALRERGEVPCGYVRQLISQEIGDIDQRLEELHRLRRELVELEERTPEVSGSEGSFCGLIDHVRQRGQPVASSPGPTPRKRLPSRTTP